MTESLKAIALVGFGGAAGAVSRYLVGGWISERVGPAFPWSTLAINASGSFVLCLVATLTLERFVVPRTWMLGVGIGFCGGFTTFSTFSYETLRLAAEGSLWRAAANIGASVAASLAAGLLGIAAGRAL